jgi:capsular polysaccharide transport system permease protein
MYKQTTHVAEIELRPLRSKGELVVDDWWEVPEPKQDPFWRRHWLAFLTMGLPMTLAILYFFVIASNQYVSEVRFIVRTSANGGSANLASFMQDQKMSRATDETSAVSEYLTSRDALENLVRNNQLLEILSRKGADIFNRFPNFYSRDTRESLYRHFLDFVDVRVESDSGIATLRVRAFTPEDSQSLAQALIKDAEAFVNRLNTRVYQDTLALANRNVAEERAKFADIEDKLEQFRNAQQIIDPNREAAAALARVGVLMAGLSKAESGLQQEIAQTPKSPQIATMSANVQSLRDEIARQREQISGSDASLAGKFSEFDQVSLDRELAARSLEGALTQLTKARQDMAQQQYYLQTIVLPNLPDQAAYPRRVLGIATVLVISFCIFWTLNALLKNVQEHQT